MRGLKITCSLLSETCCQRTTGNANAATLFSGGFFNMPNSQSDFLSDHSSHTSRQIPRLIGMTLFIKARVVFFWEYIFCHVRCKTLCLNNTGKKSDLCLHNWDTSVLGQQSKQYYLRLLRLLVNSVSSKNDFKNLDLNWFFPVANLKSCFVQGH